MCFGIAIKGDDFVGLLSLLDNLPKSTVKVFLQEGQIVMEGNVVDILGVTQFLAEHVCFHRPRRVGSFLSSVSNTANQI